MDKGAHFHKCDFQVHTPRDINWAGNGAVSDEERRQYAQEFVDACRAKGIDAVAITDHHDITFFKYIRAAAEAETDDAGKPLPPHRRLTVFPGMELTLAVPCQALLIFDADFPVDLLPQTVQALSVTPAPDGDGHHAPTQRLEHIKTLQDLYAELNKREFLRDRFIAFPHVGESGTSTLLRSGFAAQYKSMPCVGGFVDGSVTQHGKGNTDIVNGRNKDYGNKAIAVFQTSDNRSRDFARLGTHVTWVKWAQPSAEALRQACLARFSRISHGEPKLPSIRLTHIEVSNSKFLGPIALNFNPQYNTIIGGRGTGKSTILEYIRWALCDQPPGVSENAGDEVADFQRRRQSLIEGTLLPLDAVVDVTFLLNGVSHIVRRKASGELTLKIGDAPFQSCTEQNVRELLPVRAYSQKQLSAVGARLDELRRFVHAPIQADLDALQERIAGLGIDLRAAFDRVVRYRALQGEIAAHDIERHSLNEQIERLRSSLKGLSPEDSVIIARQSAYDAEQRLVQSLERDANAARQALATAATEFKRLPTAIDTRNATENRELLQQTHATLAQWLAGVQTSIAGFLDAFVEPVGGKALGQYFASIAEWRQRREAHRKQYEDAKTRAAEHEETLMQIQALEARLAELNETADVKSQQLARLGDPAGDFSTLRTEWKAAHGKRADLLEKQCKDLTAVSKSRLRAVLRRATDIEPLAERLKQLIKGTKTRGERIDNLVGQVSAAADPLETWHSILDELHALAWVRVEDENVTQLPSCPRLDNAGFTAKEKIALARQLQPSQWLDLLLFDLRDLPVFEYQVRDDDFLPFENASPGQQATALLSILLFQDGPPLLIDQPEDDLNMKIINEIVETLWQAKTHRQVMFTSHNANLVVNGDAELIICCDYRTTATESGGQIKFAGAIDIPEINREIAEVMEGGVEAFKLRYEKYGF
ncbi:MAG: TrlF family AAA-like ATPase [Candidatus Solibacter sp.]|jgi:type III restriction enzyme